MIVQKKDDRFIVYDEAIVTKIFDGDNVVEVPTQVYTGTKENAESLLATMQQQVVYYTNEVNRKQAIVDAIASLPTEE